MPPTSKNADVKRHGLDAGIDTPNLSSICRQRHREKPGWSRNGSAGAGGYVTARNFALAGVVRFECAWTAISKSTSDWRHPGRARLTCRPTGLDISRRRLTPRVARKIIWQRCGYRAIQCPETAQSEKAALIALNNAGMMQLENTRLERRSAQSREIALDTVAGQKSISIFWSNQMPGWLP